MINKIVLTECPRDAMQGIHDFISTERKAEYINTLLQVGFDIIDFGSFVSPKAIPQMRDTAEVLSKLNLENTASKLLAIIANERGAEDACAFEEIDFLGYPFSISEEFQLRNTNYTIAQSLPVVESIQNLCTKNKKKIVIYISMGFGNPYGEIWNADVVIKWVKQISGMGINIISLADTVGVSNPENISELYSNLIPEFSGVEFGAHLHTRPESWKEKVEAAFNNGCKRFDSTIKGIGGCPMAEDELVGNLATENLISYFKEKKIELSLNDSALKEAMLVEGKVFG
ncbi:MAG: hydroxymethylglutaryl-CoA lyase [Bacteroidia bacterium]|nr:hydroxymethylglutaryl-CoA lyase [Bacteroidia bacterium]